MWNVGEKYGAVIAKFSVGSGNNIMDERSKPMENVQRMFLEHAAALRGFILGLVSDRNAANDIFQEVFLAATQQANTFRADGNFLAWTRGIARNKVFEHFRSSKQSPQLLDDELLDIVASSAGTNDDVWEERREALARCIQELAPRARQILELRYAEVPTSPPEIAQKMAWTVNAVNVALSRARKYLQECTARRLKTGDP